MDKTSLISNSNVSDLNGNDMELKSHVTLVKNKKSNKKGYPEKTQIGNHKKTRSNNCEGTLSHPILINDANVEEEYDSSPEFADKRKFGKSDNVLFRRSKEIDVVVDVHQQDENIKVQKQLNDTKNTAEASKRKITIESLKSHEDTKVNHNSSYKTTVHQYDTNGRSKNLNQNRRPRNIRDNFMIEKSADSIEEYKEIFTDEDSIEEVFEVQEKDTGLNAEDSNLEPDEKLHRRRHWKNWQNSDQTKILQKPQRKRWSKDTCVIRLPEPRSLFSTTIKRGSTSVSNSDKSLSSFRSTEKRVSIFNYDNNAFVSESEDVLRIETDYNKPNPKIEMKKISDRGNRQEMVESFSPVPLNRRLFGDQRIAKDAIITIDHTEEEKENDARIPSKSNFEENKISIFRNSEESSTNSSTAKTISEVSRRRRKAFSTDHSVKQNANTRNIINDSNISEDSEEIVTNQSDYDSPEDESFKDDRKRSKKSLHAKSEDYSSRGTLSTNDDDTRESLSGKVHSEDELVIPIAHNSKRRLEKIRAMKKKIKKTSNRKDGRNIITDTQGNAINKMDKNQSKSKSKKKEQEKPIKFISIIIHKADALETNYMTKHPMVKVHIVERATGNYLKTTEIHEAKSNKLQPMITGKFDFKENRSIIPVWEEELIFEYDFEAIMKIGEEQVVIFFEIIDLLSFAEASFNYDRFGNEGSWYKIAWAFLKPIGRNNIIHTNKMVRLQLYKPQRNIKKLGINACEVYNWWKLNSRGTYPSSLFVTVSSVDPPKLEPVIYQQLSLSNLLDTENGSLKFSTRTSDSISLPKWTRLAAQSCKIPNEKSFDTDVSENGCFFNAFSNNGKYLACVFSEEYDYPIVIYEIDSAKIYVKFSGHKTFVYSLNWANDDCYLLSVSSDQTARIWDVHNNIFQHIQMLPHPSYVYCGKFNPGSTSIVVTGCYDRVARIWARNKKLMNYELSQELFEHDGFINSLCFQKDGSLLTADSVGTIILWTMKKNHRIPLKKEWCISRKIKVRELEGIIINTIILHPLESRLLVHSRNNCLQMIDLTLGIVLRKYDGLKNQRIQSTACISPCGSLIFCGGEDSSLNVWNLETGKYLAKYVVDKNFRAVTCVDYHPYDHTLAFSTFGSPAPIRILRYNKDSTGQDVGLSLIMENDIVMHPSDINVTVPNLPIKFKTRSKLKSDNEKQRYQSVSKTEESNVLLSKQNYRIGSQASVTDKNMQVENERCENTKLNFRKINETEQNVKSRSANRLYNIIEKIDRILLNSSRSSIDPESGHGSTFNHEKSENMALTNINPNVRANEQKSELRLSEHLGTKDNMNSCIESNTSFSETETAKSKIFTNFKEKRLDLAKKRPKSAKISSSNHRVFKNVTLSDSAMHSERIRPAYNKPIEIFRENTKSSITAERKKDRSPSSPSNSITLQKFTNSSTDSSGTFGSAGTYVVEKADLEKNNDADCRKTLKHTDPVKNDNTNSSKIIESDNSILSNVTFTVENERPIPKPRKKK